LGRSLEEGPAVAAISVAVSPRAIREVGQSAAGSVLEKTTLGRSFMNAA
jgi:hypothetical protein